MGNKARRRERETERERLGERWRATQRWEKTMWVDFDRWSKSITPANAHNLIISHGWQSIRTIDRLAVNQTLGGVCIPRLIWLYSIRSNSTKSTTVSSKNVTQGLSFQTAAHHLPAAAHLVVSGPRPSRDGLVGQRRQRHSQNDAANDDAENIHRQRR